MFKIIPVQTEKEQRECAELCSSQYCPGYFAYAMRDFDTDELMGFSQFELLGSVAKLHDLKARDNTDDFEAMFILGRQTLNFLEKCGAETVIAESTAGEESLLHAIGFKIGEDGTHSIAVKGIFDGHCHNH